MYYSLSMPSSRWWYMHSYGVWRVKNWDISVSFGCAKLVDKYVFILFVHVGASCPSDPFATTDISLLPMLYNIALRLASACLPCPQGLIYDKCTICIRSICDIPPTKHMSIPGCSWSRTAHTPWRCSWQDGRQMYVSSPSKLELHLIPIHMYVPLWNSLSLLL